MNYIFGKFKLLVFVLITMSIISCEEEASIPKKFFAKGTVVDLTHTPIPGVSIKKGDDLLVTSNEEGIFLLNPEQLEENDVLSFEVEGFATVHKVYKENMGLSIFMKKRGKAIVIDPSEANALQFGDSELELDIPKYAFSFKGEKYKGKVKIIATFFDVTNTLDLISAPGTYVAQGEEGNLIPLTSYGVVEVLALTLENEPVVLTSEEGIGVRIPLIVEETPSEVNLYELSEETGYWVGTGVLVNEGNQLQGVITSVNSAWNADDPCGVQLVCVKVNIQYANGNSGCYIGATGVSYQGFDGFHTPDSNGDVYLMVCPDSVFELGACWIPCCGGGFAYQTNIDMSTITLNPTGCTDIGTWVVQN